MLCADVLDLFHEGRFSVTEFLILSGTVSTVKMVCTRRNEYLPMQKEQVVKNLELLEITFNATTQSGKFEQWGQWQGVIQYNVTSALAYIERNEFRMEDVEAKIEEIDGEIRWQIAAVEKNCADHTNLVERYPDIIRRKELTKLKNELESRLNTLENCWSGYSSATWNTLRMDSEARTGKYKPHREV